MIVVSRDVLSAARFYNDESPCECKPSEINETHRPDMPALFVALVGHRYYTKYDRGHKRAAEIHKVTWYHPRPRPGESFRPRATVFRFSCFGSSCTSQRDGQTEARDSFESSFLINAVKKPLGIDRSNYRIVVPDGYIRLININEWPPISSPWFMSPQVLRQCASLLPRRKSSGVAGQK